MSARSDISKHRYKRSDPYQLRAPNLTERSYDEIAKAMGISVARVGQLESTGLERLRRCYALIDGGMRVDDAIEACKGRPGRPRRAS